MSLLPIIAKLGSESFMSLYPVFVKYYDIGMTYKVWNRTICYLIISSFFVDWKFVWKHILDKYVILLSIITLLHIYFSFRGFLLLESGISYAIFYTYPIMIIMMSQWKEGISLSILVSLIIILFSVYLLAKQDDSKKEIVQKIEPKTKAEEYEGILMILLAAFTEACIFFMVRRISTSNNWNQLFFSYLFCGILISIYVAYRMIRYPQESLTQNYRNQIVQMTLFNIFIGTVANFLKYFAMYRLSPLFYGILSYFGIITAFLYGVIFYGDKITIKKIIGIILIIITNLWMLFQSKR